MTTITPITFPILGLATKLDLIVLNFSMAATTADFYYCLYSEDDKKITDGNISMTESEFAQWGADNSYCISWACQKLGLQISE
jgi:hypothetical protein